MSDVKMAATEGVESVLDVLRKQGVPVALSAEQVELVAEGVIVVVDLINRATLKAAHAAGVQAAAAVTTVEQANEVLKAAAATQEPK